MIFLRFSLPLFYGLECAHQDDRAVEQARSPVIGTSLATQRALCDTAGAPSLSSEFPRLNLGRGRSCAVFGLLRSTNVPDDSCGARIVWHLGHLVFLSASSSPTVNSAPQSSLAHWESIAISAPLGERSWNGSARGYYDRIPAVCASAFHAPLRSPVLDCCLLPGEGQCSGAEAFVYLPAQ